VLNGDDITPDHVADLTFEADGDLLAALHEAYITLMEFAYDREARRLDRSLDCTERAALRECLNKIVSLAE